MATTVTESFRGCKSNLEITDLQQTTVANRQKSVRDAVSRKMNVIDSFVTGSYKRHTMISPLKDADIDVFLILNSSEFASDGYTALLDKVRAVLLETYPSTPKISRNGQAVTITFTDFVVDVVPGFHRKGGGYLIPSTPEKRWIPTNPKVHETAITAANELHNGDLVPLIKMIKAWNREISSPFRSFYLELMVEKLLRGVTISSFPSGCRYVFDKGRVQIKSKIADPAGFKNQLNPLGTGSVEEAVQRFETAYGRAIKAEQLDKSGDSAAAVAEWQKIFGSSFPAYG